MAALAHTAPSHVFADNEGFFSSLVARFNAWNLGRQTRDELMKLSDRELADVGLTRGDIDEVAFAHLRG